MKSVFHKFERQSKASYDVSKHKNWFNQASDVEIIKWLKRNVKYLDGMYIMHDNKKLSIFTYSVYLACINPYKISLVKILLDLFYDRNIINKRDLAGNISLYYCIDIANKVINERVAIFLLAHGGEDLYLEPLNEDGRDLKYYTGLYNSEIVIHYLLRSTLKRKNYYIFDDIITKFKATPVKLKSILRKVDNKGYNLLFYIFKELYLRPNFNDYNQAINSRIKTIIACGGDPINPIIKLAFANDEIDINLIYFMSKNKVNVNYKVEGYYVLTWLILTNNLCAITLLKLNPSDNALAEARKVPYQSMIELLEKCLKNERYDLVFKCLELYNTGFKCDKLNLQKILYSKYHKEGNLLFYLVSLVKNRLEENKPIGWVLTKCMEFIIKNFGDNPHNSVMKLALFRDTINIKLMESLLEMGISPNVTIDKNYLLTYAVRNKDKQSVKILLAYKPNEAVIKDAQTMMKHKSTNYSYSHTIKLLIDNYYKKHLSFLCASFDMAN